jgi:LmbE family N-acetylglucosaminyl deacetylase
VSDESSLEPFPEDWSRALAIVAHPDDLEYGAAAAIARWVDQGKEVAYVMVTDGEAGIDTMPPEEVGPLRREEEIRSAEVVGVETVEFLGFADGLVEADVALRAALARVIRTHRPDVVVSINFRESFGPGGWNHVDHRNVGIALLDAARDAGNRWLFTDDGLDPWDGVRFVAFGASPLASHWVDVTDTIDRGVRSLEQHEVYLSVLSDGTPGTEPDSFLRGFASRAGESVGVDYAATFELISV